MVWCCRRTLPQREPWCVLRKNWAQNHCLSVAFPTSFGLISGLTSGLISRLTFLGRKCRVQSETSSPRATSLSLRIGSPLSTHRTSQRQRIATTLTVSTSNSESGAQSGAKSGAKCVIFPFLHMNTCAGTLCGPSKTLTIPVDGKEWHVSLLMLYFTPVFTLFYPLASLCSLDVAVFYSVFTLYVALPLVVQKQWRVALLGDVSDASIEHLSIYASDCTPYVPLV